MTMSTAAAADAAPAKGGKKLLLFAIIGVVVLAVAAVAAVLLLKKHGAQDEDEALDEPPAATQSTKKKKAAVAPTFLPLDTFTVNLADRQAERYAQVGITLEVESPEVVEQLKAFMPAIRSNILMLLSQKTATELYDRAGKEQLAMEIMREAVRPLGIELDEEPPAAPNGKARKRPAVHNPILAVHFSNFIIQ
jgi:flagellar FliL protein